MRSESIKVTVTMPERLFSKLADLGEVYDMRVDELLIELSAQALAKRAPDLSNPIVSRWREGWSDKLIAIDLGMTNAAVADQRRKFGLPANSNKGRLGLVRKSAGLPKVARVAGGEHAVSSAVSGSHGFSALAGSGGMSEAIGVLEDEREKAA